MQIEIMLMGSQPAIDDDVCPTAKMMMTGPTVHCIESHRLKHFACLLLDVHLHLAPIPSLSSLINGNG